MDLVIWSMLEMFVFLPRVFMVLDTVYHEVCVCVN